MTAPTTLTYDRCLELLAVGAMGRVAVCTPAGPKIVPVDYCILDDSVVFRVALHSVLGTYGWNTQLAFEVDQFDSVTRQGWSVVATGRGATIDDRAEITAIRDVWDPQPWANGQGLMYVRLPWKELNGLNTEAR